MGLGESFVKKTEDGNDGIRMKFRVCYLLRRQYTSQYGISPTFWSTEEEGIRLFSLPQSTSSYLLYSWFSLRILDLPWDSLEYVKKKKFDNYWRKLSDSIPQKKGIRWFFNCHQIWSLNPTYRIFAFWRLFQEIIWSESSLKFQNTNLLDRLWITKILFTNVKWGNIFLF